MKRIVIGAAVICCSLFIVVNKCSSQNNFKCVTKGLSGFSELAFEYVSPIPDLQTLIALNLFSGYESTLRYKVVFFDDSFLPSYKVLMHDKKYNIISACAYDSTYIALYVGSYERYPLLIYKLTNSRYVLNKKLRIDDSIMAKGFENIFYLKENELLLSSTFNFGKKNGELDKIRLGIYDIKRKKIKKSFEMDFGVSILYSYFPKQWVSVNQDWIVLINPLTSEFYVFDHKLNQFYKTTLDFLDNTKTMNILDSTFDKQSLLTYEYKPKLIIDNFLQNDLLNAKRIEKIFFISDEEIAISTILNKNYKDGRSVYIYNVMNHNLTDSFNISYSGNPNLFEFRYSGGRYFNRNGMCLYLRSSPSTNKDSMYYQNEIWSFTDANKDFVQKKELSALNIFDEYRKPIYFDSLNNIDEVIFINLFKCEGCLKKLKNNCLVISVDDKRNTKSRILLKNELYKKYGLKNIYFIEKEYLLEKNKLLLNTKLNIID